MTILEQFNYEDIAEFKRDFVLVMNMSTEIDRQFGSVDQSFMHNLPEFSKTLELFSKKYRDIVLKPDTSPSIKNLDIFFDVKSIMDVYDIAKRIDGCRAIGKDSTGLIDIKETAKVNQLLSRITNKIYLAYYTPAKSKSIIIKFNPAEKKPELIYDKEGITEEESPEFKLCAYYGCLNGFDKKIDLRKVASSFYKPGKGFMTPTRMWR